MNEARSKYNTTPGSSIAGTSSSALAYDQLPNESYMTQHGHEHNNLDSSERQRNIARKCAITVSGYPAYVTQDIILNYFSKFGKIVWVHFGHKVAHLDYGEPSAVRNVMQRQHFLKGKLVRVRQREKVFKRRARSERREKEKRHITVDEPTDYIQYLKDVPKIDDQLQIIIQHLQPHVQEQPPKYNQIYTDLHTILSPTFPQCKVHPFGSTITGLNFINSDIDIYISGIAVEGGKDKPLLNKIKALLIKSERFTANTDVRVREDISILRCAHIETGINCVINLRNYLGICNSKLIKYYLDIDSKVKDLFVFLKCWAKVHKFTGQGCFLSNYALSMMLIFFLQQEPYNIPSVLLLQKDPTSFYSHDSWNGEFQEIPVIAASLRCTSLLTLLENFFSFYANFDYRDGVICPFLGRAMKKDQFEYPETLPDSFNPYKAYLEFGPPFKARATICVQDPFKHSQNITPRASSAVLGRFVHFCHLGKKLCQAGENSVLYNLLTMIPSYKKTELILKPEFSQFAIPMGPNLRYIEEEVPDNIPNRHEAIQEAWFKNIVEFTMIVLKDFLKLEVSELCDPAKEAQSNVYDSKKDQVSFQCLGRINLWESRSRRTQMNIKQNVGIVEKEIMITNELCHLYKDITQSSPVINFEITLRNNLSPPEMALNMKKISAYMNTYKTFANFLLENLSKWFEAYEKELNLCKG